MDAFSLWDSTPGRHKGSLLCIILRYPSLVTDPKTFQKAPSAPIYSNFEEEGAEKMLFFEQSFPKSA